MPLSGIARVAAKIALVIAVIAVLRLYVFEHYVDQHEIKALIQQTGALAPVTFIGILMLTALVYLPSALVVGLGAILFGMTLGPLLSLAGLVLGASSAYLIGKHAAPEAAEGLLERRFKRFRRFKAWADSNAFSFVMCLRLTSFFDTATNYVVGTTRVGFWSQLAGTLVGFIPPVYLVSFSFEVIWKAQTLKGMTIYNPYVWCLPVLRGLGLWMLVARSSRHRDAEADWPAGEQEAARG
jgi:uncharacterized membrane protein YdjX (TVP38/TMEM64 family)